MRAHVVGNGPSWANFNKIEDTDFVIGCNVTKVECADVTMMSDKTLCRQIQHKINHGRWQYPPLPPVIANPDVLEWIETEGRVKFLTIYSTYQRPADFSGNEMSSAHYGLIWAIEHGYTEIHVWGIDSYNTNNLFSHTDQIKKLSGLKQSQENSKATAERWKMHWHRIIDENPQVKVVLHV